MRTLHKHIQRSGNRLCLGLDLDPELIPASYQGRPDPLFELGRDLIDATLPLVAAYKPNSAFYEQFGASGMATLEKLIRHINGRAFVVLDAKRGDIGNTSRRYARAAFRELDVDMLTLAPYMGRDSLEPFLMEGAELEQRDQAAGREPRERGAFVLALTSNAGSVDFQNLRLENGRTLFQQVLHQLAEWNQDWGRNRLGAVVGATKPEQLAEIRSSFPELPLLIPGVGAQGGDPAEVTAILSEGSGPALVNVSRGILLGKDTEIQPAAAARRAEAFAKSLGLS